MLREGHGDTETRRYGAPGALIWGLWVRSRVGCDQRLLDAFLTR